MVPSEVITANKKMTGFHRNQKKHFIAYVRWDVILDWKRSEIINKRLSKNEHLKPFAYGTGARGIEKKIRDKDIIWIFSIPVYGSFSSFPSLIAMLTVAEVIDQKNENDIKRLNLIPDYIKKHWNPVTKKGWQFVIIGEKSESKYFPINNMYDLMISEFLKDKSANLEKRIAGKHYGLIAHYFQTIRIIPKDKHKKIIVYKKGIDKKATVFISYRHRRSTRIVAFIESLLKKGANCWLDVNRMAQHLPEQYKEQSTYYFRKEIENSIKESSVFVAIIDNDYFESEWTVFEYNIAKTQAKKTQKPTIIEKNGPVLQNINEIDSTTEQILNVLRINI